MSPFALQYPKEPNYVKTLAREGDPAYKDTYKDGVQSMMMHGCLPVRPDLQVMAERARRIDNTRIQRILNERGVQALFHFTPIDNLRSLSLYGLLSRAELAEHQLSFIPTDELRIDGVNNASCLSLAFPNYKMFFHKRCSLTNVTNWAVLEICTSVLWESPCLFLPHNAASLVSNLKKSPGYLLGAPALDRVFEESKIVSRHEMGLRPDLPTDPQTEILAFGQIANEKVKAVLVDDSRSLNHARETLADSEFEDRIKIDSSPFKPRYDYCFWTH